MRRTKDEEDEGQGAKAEAAAVRPDFAEGQEPQADRPPSGPPKPQGPWVCGWPKSAATSFGSAPSFSVSHNSKAQTRPSPSIRRQTASMQRLHEVTPVAHRSR